MKRKIPAIIILSMMFMSMLAGCGGDTSDQKVQTAVAESVAESVAERKAESDINTDETNTEELLIEEADTTEADKQETDTEAPGTDEIRPADELGRVLFIGDSRCIDMFEDTNDPIEGEIHNGIVIYAEHGRGFDYLRDVIEDVGYNSFDTLVTWMGGNDRGEFWEYENLYNRVLEKDKKLIPCTLGPTDDRYLTGNDIGKYENEKMTAFNDSLTAWAEDKDVKLMDLYTFCYDNIEIDPADGTHFLPRPTTELWDKILSELQKTDW